MSWVEDITAGVWQALADFWLGRLNSVVVALIPVLHSTEEPLKELFGYIFSLKERAAITQENELQRLRLEEMQGKEHYPPDVGMIAPLVTHGNMGRRYVEYIARLQGKFPSTIDAFRALARKRPDLASLRELYNRGFVTDEYVAEILEEEGFQDEITNMFYSETPGVGDHATGIPTERLDRTHLLELFKIMPGIGSIITMEVRDAFPKAAREHPDTLQGTPDFEKWKVEHLADPEVYQWEPGSGKGITDALKQDSEYGPQSFASDWIGAREQYTTTFEKAAEAQGLDPYWAMKFWEAHWQLPGFAVIREMLYRVPRVTEEMAAQILRWQDFPPALIDDMVKVAYRPLTRVDVRRMHLRGVLGVTRVFQSYLAFGYNAQNAADMTAFTVLWNMDRLYGSVIKEILKSFAERAIDEETATTRIWEFVGGDIPTQLPPEITDQLTGEQIEAVLQTYQNIRVQKIQWIVRELRTTKATAALKRSRAYLDTAEKMFVSWQWNRETVLHYLAEKGFSTDRISTIMEDWQPFRDAKEKLPSAAMLEDFLLEQEMPVEIWRDQMRKLRYSDAVIMSILEGVGTLPSRAMLEDFFVKEIITLDAFKRYMKQLGYKADTVAKILESMRIEAEENE